MTMNSDDWLRALRQRCPEVDLLPPGPASVLDRAEHEVGTLPDELRDFLRQANGMNCRSFRLLSAFDERLPKKTWESLQRANNPATARALGGDPELLSRFLVFADIGNGFAFFDRADGSIWFQESGEDEAAQTTLSFQEFLKTMIANAD